MYTKSRAQCKCNAFTTKLYERLLYKMYTKSTAQCKSKESQVGCGLIVPSQGASFDTVVCTSARIYALVYYDLTFKFTGSTLHTTASQCCSNFLGTFYLTCSTVNITLNNIEHHFSLNWTLAHSDTATPQSPLVETSVERNQPEKCHLSVVWRALQSSIVKDNHNLDVNEGHTYVERNYAREVRPVSFVRRALTLEEVPLETQGALLSSGII